MRRSVVIGCAFFIVLGSTQGVGADAPFAATSSEWDGCSEIVSLARRSFPRVEVLRRLDVGTLRPTDALVLIEPEGDVNGDALGGFLRAGGRAAIANERGAGSAIFAAYGIRRAPTPSDALRLRGNPNLLVARPIADHPLADRVEALVTNHADALDHPRLSPLFTVGERSAIVVAGAVGRGRLVAISDSSLFINNMQRFRGNRQFATNLFRYLASPTSRLVIMTGPSRVGGRYGEPGADRPLHDVRAMVERFAHFPLDPLALRILAALVLGLFAIVATSSFPRDSRYTRSEVALERTHVGGYAGRVAFPAGSGKNYLLAALAYRYELERSLLSLLGRDEATFGEVAAALTKRGASPKLIGELRTVVQRLDELAYRQDRPPGPPVVTSAEFVRIVEHGERALGAIGEPDRSRRSEIR